MVAGAGKEHKMKGKKGLNQYRWNLVIKKMDNQSAYFINYLRFPPAGTYSLHIIVDDIIMKKEFVILK